MERLYKKRGEDSQQQEICKELETKFRMGLIPIKSGILKIHLLFLKHYLSCNGKSTSYSRAVLDAARNPLPTINPSPNALKNIVSLSKAWDDAKIPTKPKAQRVAELPDLIFEALSSKDCAWYDVAVFLNFRRWRNSHDEDEWVNARNGVRERSIPLVASECHKVKVADLVLCYRANEDHALYSDAHVVRIERKLHDDANCTFGFVDFCKYAMEVEYRCKHYEAYGLLCRHIFYVLRMNSIKEFPQKYLNKRWLKNAKPFTTAEPLQPSKKIKQRGDKNWS
ncbi:protein SAWADEE homeodomain homolog 1 [Tanacetum coccineum]